MQEGEGGREGGVMIDYIGQVGHAFVAFVQGCGEVFAVRGVQGVRGGGRVDGIDCSLPAGRKVSRGEEMGRGAKVYTRASTRLPSRRSPAQAWP